MTSGTPIDDPTGAFLPGARVTREGRPGGALDGVRFAAKDIYDVAGAVTGCGNPDWARTHPAAEQDSWAVAKLLAAGAEGNGGGGGYPNCEQLERVLQSVCSPDQAQASRPVAGSTRRKSAATERWVLALVVKVVVVMQPHGRPSRS